MTNLSSFRCFLIGSDTLLAQCGEILLARGHQVTGVVTREHRISEWAVGKGLSVHSADTDYASVLADSSFDYLFAITHLELIPEAAVSAPKRMAINFHDGPLPAYAGLNTPMWAIMNGETEYAISWHTLSAGIDTGDILLQHPVSISEDDSALSLNTKCFAAALESFPTVVEELAHKKIGRVPQDLSKRTYFARNRKPPAASVLDWRRSASQLDRQIRGLNTGNYANEVGVAKLLLAEEAIIVDSAAVVAAEGSAAPGQILSLSEQDVTIGTGDGAIRVFALKELDGRPLTIAKLTQRNSLSVGQTLPHLTENLAVHFSEIVKQQSLYEPDLTRRFARVGAMSVPYRDSPESKSIQRNRRSIEIPDAVKGLPNDLSTPQVLAGAFVQFLARVQGDERIHFAVSAPHMRDTAEYFDSLFASHTFLEIELDENAKAWAQTQRCADLLDSALQDGPWLRDLIARQPSLQGIPCLEVRSPLRVAIVFGEISSSDLLLAELVLRIGDDGSAEFDCSSAYSSDSLKRICADFSALLDHLGEDCDAHYRELRLLPSHERLKLLNEWNPTSVDYDHGLTIPKAFESQVEATPDATAVVCIGEAVSYAELNQRAEVVARTLSGHGIDPNALVGVHVPRSIDLVVATLGVLKAGGAYVPLDPAFPKDRLEYMIADSAMSVIISHSSISHEVSGPGVQIIEVDGLDLTSSHSKAKDATDTSSTDLSYVIYTSGSTGQPKGVMIEHRNAINFFEGMDQAFPYDQANPGTWIAVTSLSFDISVLELLWTLTRGFKVVIHDESRTKMGGEAPVTSMSRKMGIGLFMWGNDDAPGPAKYRLLMEGSKYFDEHGFHAVWTPERHFHAFGGPYPNPAVTGAAVAAVTNHIKIRAGSCVVPLHHPVRIAEEWSVVDNLSNGRVEIAAASGWNPNDFVLKPENHANNKEVMMTQLDEVRRLWRGETLSFPGPLGKDVEVQSLPRPVQPDLPCWITTAGNPETWRAAGEGGFNVLTHLLGQTVDEVGEKIRIYREARAAAGFDTNAGQVALMLHTFVGEDDDDVRESVRAPMKSYLASSMRLAMNFAWSFPAFKRPGGQDTKPEDVDIASLSDGEVDTILDFAFDRYFSNSGLFGTVDTCLDMLRRCSAIGVSEIACLLDFGVDTDLVMDSLPLLTELRERADADVSTDTVAADGDYSFAGMVASHSPTHMQCTPSMARMYLSSSDSAAAFKTISHLLLGGEALPVELAKTVNYGRDGTLTNMYGPTETTIWSTSHRVSDTDDVIPIGRPIANTRCYILDKFRCPVPVGIPGELYIGGDGVARGYLKRPELTEERFVPDPFSSIESARMYATGDLAKYRDDGTIEYIGRTDFQVKIRGYRIELGEIEASLEMQKGVTEAAVIVRAEDDSDQRLVAFVIAADGASPDVADLRSALRETLPEYMVPSEIASLLEMPRTANGKLDRKALINLKLEKTRELTEEAAPQDDTQKKIAELWQETLRLEQVGIDENFFDLGGHSLLVVQLHNQLKEILDLPLSLTDLYQYPTIRSLSDFLSSGGRDESLKKGTSRGARRRALRKRSA